VLKEPRTNNYPIEAVNPCGPWIVQGLLMRSISPEAPEQPAESFCLEEVKKRCSVVEGVVVNIVSAAAAGGRLRNKRSARRRKRIPLQVELMAKTPTG
jgi:hypothetical protein